MKILVTGGAGFIGSHLCDRLLAAGHDVVVADDLSLGCLDNIAHLRDVSGFEFHKINASDLESMLALFHNKGFECVFHMAANSDIAKSHGRPEIDFCNTLETTWVVLEAMRKTRVRQIVFASTSAIYGEMPGRIHESRGPLKPISHYGAAKLASEGFISSFGENYDIQAWIARLPNVVGDRLTHGAIYDFAHKLRGNPERLEVLGNGTQVKPYLHVSDLLDALFIAWKGLASRTNIFNVGGSTRCSVARMAEIVVEEFGTSARIHFTGGNRGWIGDVPSVDYDTSVMNNLGWTPKLNSDEAVRLAARWMFRNSR